MNDWNYYAIYVITVWEWESFKYLIFVVQWVPINVSGILILPLKLLIFSNGQLETGDYMIIAKYIIVNSTISHHNADIYI
jgi:hypothetical protein